MVSEPKPLAPGEKALVDDRPRAQALDPARRTTRCCGSSASAGCARNGAEEVGRLRPRAARPAARSRASEVPGYSDAGPEEPVKVADRVLAGFGWQRDDVKLVQQMASNGAEPIGSLGYDGPLAALSPERQNLADYFKETVAVVTNPAIDREREIEHFSTRAVFGRRPSIDAAGDGHRHGRDRLPGDPRRPPRAWRRSPTRPTAGSPASTSTYLLEDLWEEFRGRAGAVDISLLESETTQGAIERIKQEAVKKVRDGAELLVLTDRTVYDGERRYLDPHLATSAVDQALKQFRVEPGEENLRRRCGDRAALGGDPQRPRRDAGARPRRQRRLPLHDGRGDLRRGLRDRRLQPLRGAAQGDRESDLDDRDPRGARLRAPVLLDRGQAGAGRDLPDRGLRRLREGRRRLRRARRGHQRARRGSSPATRTPKPAKTFRFYPKVYKAAIATANGSGDLRRVLARRSATSSAQSPISMRHIMGLKGDREPVDPAGVDAGVGHHDYPIVISSMSFGSQSEPAFRAYAEAAKAINILCVNGEGGEIRDMYGHYRKWRGQQVASGRFGVSAEMLNSSYVAEIKIGQGAKPGEGGHLPGKKVSEKVAAARNAAPGTDLISPSNNHDLYSIEDLAELIDELKTVNPDVRVSVKVPVVPNIGTIGLGIAKAGADIITLSGFEGGTGAARQHALRHVGLPSDIGTRAVHRALMEAGIRNRVEIWADGGYRHGHDIVKLHCLGANRVGFGTLAMVSLGCTICRGCQLDTCHVGIATQIETVEQAQEHGLKKFTPQEVDARRRELRPLLRGDGRGGQGGRRLARLRARPGPGRPLRPARAGLATTSRSTWRR